MSIPAQDKLILTLSEGIAHQEGFYRQDINSVAKRNNNPGNLRGWSSNTEKDDQGFDIFDKIHEGWEALYRQVEINIYTRNLTLTQFFRGTVHLQPGDKGYYAGYLAGDSDYNKAKYISHLEYWLEDRGFRPLSANTVLSEWYKGEMFNDVLETANADLPIQAEITHIPNESGVSLVKSNFLTPGVYGLRVDDDVFSLGTPEPFNNEWKVVKHLTNTD